MPVNILVDGSIDDMVSLGAACTHQVSKM